MTITKKGFIDLGNGLFLNYDLVKHIDNTHKSVMLVNGEIYHYGELMPLPNETLREECFDSYKGDFYYFKKKGLQ